MARFIACNALDPGARCWQPCQIDVDDITRAEPSAEGSLLWLGADQAPIRVDMAYANVAAVLGLVPRPPVIDPDADTPAGRVLRDALLCLRELRGCTVGTTDIGRVYAALVAATDAGFTLSRRT